MTPSSDADDRHTAGLVRAADPDRWRAVLYAEERLHPGLFAIYAFNVELGRLRETVREPLLGAIRLQWWREALAELTAGQVRDHPVLRALHRHLGNGPALQALAPAIEARGADFEPTAPVDFDGYAVGTASSLLSAGLMMAGAEPEVASAIVRPAGIAQVSAGIVRAAAYFAATGRAWYGPADWPRLTALGVENLALARDLARSLPAPARLVLLPLATAGYDLALLRRAQHDPARAHALDSPFARRWALAWRALAGRP